MPSDSCLTDDEVLRLIALPLPELQRQARLAFRIVPDQAAILRHFADALLAEIRRAQREPVRLILPVGPVSQYRAVVATSNREGLSWKHVHVFAMDEFLDWEARPIPTSHHLSFEGFLRRELFGQLDAALRPPESQLHFPHPLKVDELSEQIRSGGIDACFGGIGYHGHVAFNDPPLSRWHRVSVDQLRRSRTRVLTLGDDSVVVQSIHSAGGCSAAIPPMAVTLGLGDLLSARKIRLYCAAGERHRAIFRISVAATPCIEYPSTLVQGHPDAEVITDAPTAAPIELGIR